MVVDKFNESQPIRSNDVVTIKHMGNIVEVVYSEKLLAGGHITKLDKDQFVDNRTGEVKEFVHIENRSQDLSNVAKSMSAGRAVLNTNITDVKKCRWVTLTYRENMTDPKKLQIHFQHFNERCRAVFGHYEYITCAEPQGRGAWHLHVVMIFDHKAPYMANDVIANMWKQGFVTVKRLDDVDNVGSYLTAYLGDMELMEFVEKCPDIKINANIKEVEYLDEHGEKQKKKYVKGARLHMYPAGFHIFRYSKGIKKPTVEKMTYKEAKKILGESKLTYAKSICLSDDDANFSNTLTYEYYNRIRK